MPFLPSPKNGTTTGPPDAALPITLVGMDHIKSARHVPDPEKRPTVKVEEAAVILGISRTSAYVGVRAGEIPSIKIGQRIVVPTAALRRLLLLDT